jgi:hypothetical protein
VAFDQSAGFWIRAERLPDRLPADTLARLIRGLSRDR